MEPRLDAPEGAAQKRGESLDDDRRVLAVCLPTDRPPGSPRKQSASDGAPAVDERSEAENDGQKPPTRIAPREYLAAPSVTRRISSQ